MKLGNIKKLPEKYLKINLQINNSNIKTYKINGDMEKDAIVENADKAYEIHESIIGPNEIKTYELRMWMDESVTLENEDSINAKYEGRVSIEFNYVDEPQTIITGKEDIKRIAKYENETNESGVVKVSHSEADIKDVGYNNATTAINNLKQTEYRYYGKDPNNYVKFNNELWRIIGLVNTPEGQRIKLIRIKSENKSWNSTNENGWTNSALKKYLNEEFEFTNEAKDMIDTVTWNLGGVEDYKNGSNGLVNHWYNYERGAAVYSGNQKLWLGEVGLIYPSDYGYATSGGSTYSRSECLQKELYVWGNNDYKTNCAMNNWLYSPDAWQWTLTTSSGHADYAYRISTNGHILYDNNASVSTLVGTRAVIYLKENIDIIEGLGTIDNPYILGVKKNK